MIAVHHRQIKTTGAAGGFDFSNDRLINPCW